MIKLFLAVVLATVSIGAWADSRVTIADLQNGTITASGEQTVTLTVTPAANYYIEAGDIIVSKTADVAQARQQAPGYADKLKVTAVSTDDTGKGTYQFTLPDGYGAYVEATFTPCIAISPTVTITGWTYGAIANIPVVTGNTGKGAETFTYASKGADAFSATVPENAGEYTVKATIAATGHYLAGEATANFTIAKAAGNISYGQASISKTYGEADFINELTKVGDGTVTFTSDNSSVATVDATTGKVTIVGNGTAKITATVTDGKNYTYATKTASYTLGVGTAAMDVTASGFNGIYDGRPHGISVTAPKGATVKYGEQAGSYTLTASPTYTDAGTYTVYYEATMQNYTPVTNSAVVTIAKAPLKITADDKTKKCGEDNPELTVSYEGFVNNETSDVLTKKPIVTTKATAESSAGTYDIIAEGAEATNYSITYVNGTLTIEKIVGDANGDGEVNVADIDYIIERIGEPYETNKDADVNGDGEINVADIDYIIERIN